MDLQPTRPSIQVIFRSVDIDKASRLLRHGKARLEMLIISSGFKSFLYFFSYGIEHLLCYSVAKLEFRLFCKLYTRKSSRRHPPHHLSGVAQDYVLLH